jgi:antitoxin PrlF
MLVTNRGQITIPKRIRDAAGVAPGSEVSFSIEGSKIIMTRIATSVRSDRRVKLRAAAARVRDSMRPEFQQLSADDIMAFLRGDDQETHGGGSRRGRPPGRILR